MCAYNPGVQSRAGEFYAQGMSALGRGVGDAMRQYGQNKIMAGQAVAKFEGVFKADPALAQVLQSPDAPPEAAKAFAKLQKEGNLGVRDAALLAQFADSYSQEKAQLQRQEAQKLQMEAFRAQTEAEKMKMRQMQQQEAQLNQLRQFGQFSQGVGTGVLRGDVQDRMSSQMAANPFLRTSAQLAQATGRPPEAEALLQFAAKPAPPALDLEKVREADAQGNPIEVAYDKRTGKKFASGPLQTQPRAYPTPQEAADTELLKTEAQETAKNASAFVKGIQDAAEAGRVTLGTIGRIYDAYERGATSQFGQPFLTDLRSIGQALGVKDDKLGTQQALEGELGRMAFEQARILMQGGGAVSDFERQSLERAMANPNRSPEANRIILGAMKSIAERAAKLEEERQKLVDQKIGTPAIQERLLRLRASLPIAGMDQLMNATTSTPAGSGLSAVEQAELEMLRAKLSQ